MKSTISQLLRLRGVELDIVVNNMCVSTAMFDLVEDATLQEIFKDASHTSFTPEEIQAFGSTYKSHLLDEDRATLFLRNFGPWVGFDVVGLERDDHGQLDENVFNLTNPWVWEAAAGHRVVLRTSPSSATTK